MAQPISRRLSNRQGGEIPKATSAEAIPALHFTTGTAFSKR